MILKYCDICGEEEKDNDIIVKIGYYGIEIDACTKCRSLIEAAYKKAVTSLFDQVRSEIKEIRSME